MAETDKTNGIAFTAIINGRDDKKRWEAVYVAPSIARLKEMVDANEKPSLADDSSENDPDETPHKEVSEEEIVDELSEVGKGIWHFYDNLKSYFEIAMVIDEFPKIFPSSYFRSYILKNAQENYSELEKYNDVQIYTLSQPELTDLNGKVSRWNQISEGFERTPSAILLSLVATFDSSFAEYCKTLLRQRPERYNGSDKKYSIKDIVALGSVDKLIEKLINDDVDEIMYRSHTDQIAFFEEKFDIKIRNGYDNWPSFTEIFERRNLAAHGDLIVNDKYIDNCAKVGCGLNDISLGDKLNVDSEYLTKSIETLIEFGILLSLSVWQKQVPEKIQESFTAVVEVSYDLLKESRPTIAERILDYALMVKSKGANDLAVKMMTVNLAIALKMQSKEDEAYELLDRSDWSATGDLFTLCTAAVKEDISTVVATLPKAVKAELLGPISLRTWPAFKWVRKDKDFQSIFEATFGEPLEISSSIKSERLPSDVE